MFLPQTKRLPGVARAGWRDFPLLKFAFQFKGASWFDPYQPGQTNMIFGDLFTCYRN